MSFIKKTGSVVCPYCGKLVGVQDQECWSCGRRNPGLWGFAPLLRKLGFDLGFTSIVTWGCAALYIATLLYDPRGIGMSGLMNILSPSTHSVELFGASGFYPVFQDGRWWTVLSAAWLHGSFLHILFNMLWVRDLAPATAELYGASRAVIIYTISSITGFVLSSCSPIILTIIPLPFLHGAGYTLGASAPIFGLLGAMVVYGRRGGSSHIGNQAITYAIILFISGFIMPGIDNFAHLGGFVGGFAAAYVLNPMRPERLTHLIAALICLALTALSILASFLPALLA